MTTNICKEISEKFKKAEKITKKVESMHGSGVCIPAINELRYCGSHLTDALTCTDNTKNESYMKALRHCNRAIYDASEASILASFKKFDSFRKEYKNVYLVDIIPNYPKILESYKKAQEYVNENNASKEEHYQELYNHSVVLYKGMITIESLEEELKKKKRTEGITISTFHIKVALFLITAIGSFISIN